MKLSEIRSADTLVDAEMGRIGEVISRTGPRSGNRMNVRSIRVRWDNGQIEDFEDELPDGIVPIR